MNQTNIATGQWDEKIAENFLTTNGYDIVARNFHVRNGEIDIIAQKEGVIVFVEVKTRTSNHFAYPEEAVSYRKKERMRAAAEIFIERYQEKVETWQFDIIAIVGKPGQPPEITHFENVID